MSKISSITTDNNQEVFLVDMSNSSKITLATADTFLDKDIMITDIEKVNLNQAGHEGETLYVNNSGEVDSHISILVRNATVRPNNFNSSTYTATLNSMFAALSETPRSIIFSPEPDYINTASECGIYLKSESTQNGYWIPVLGCRKIPTTNINVTFTFLF